MAAAPSGAATVGPLVPPGLLATLIEDGAPSSDATDSLDHAPPQVVVVTPHVFADGQTLVSIADEGLHPWGFYDGSKGQAAPARPPVASRLAFLPGGTATDATGAPGAPRAALVLGTGSAWGTPGPLGIRQGGGPCHWRSPDFGSAASRNRCGHPTVARASGPGGFPVFVGGGGGGSGGGGSGGGGSGGGGGTPGNGNTWPGDGGPETGLPPGGPGTPGSPPTEPPVIAPVPLPAGAWLLLAALGALALRARR